MSKQIKIEIEEHELGNGEYSVSTKLSVNGNISPFEMLGIFTYYQKQLFIQISKDSDLEVKTQKLKK